MKNVKRIQKQIPGTEYLADIHITQEESTTRYNIYGRLLDKNGIRIPGIKTKSALHTVGKRQDTSKRN